MEKIKQEGKEKGKAKKKKQEESENRRKECVRRGEEYTHTNDVCT